MRPPVLRLFALLAVAGAVSCGASGPVVSAGASTPLDERTDADPFARLEEQTAIVAYEFGRCEVDADCAPRGCGGSVCSVDDVPSVCLLSPVSECLSRVPASSCGCVEGACRWARNAPVLLCATRDEPPAGNRGFRRGPILEEYPVRLNE